MAPRFTLWLHICPPLSVCFISPDGDPHTWAESRAGARGAPAPSAGSSPQQSPQIALGKDGLAFPQYPMYFATVYAKAWKGQSHAVWFICFQIPWKCCSWSFLWALEILSVSIFHGQEQIFNCAKLLQVRVPVIQLKKIKSFQTMFSSWSWCYCQ